MRGVGYQFQGAIINIIAFYVFGLPIGITLVIVVDMGVVGMWIGLAIAGIIQSISYSIVLLCLNWPKELAMLATKHEEETITELEMNGNYSTLNSNTDDDTLSGDNSPLISNTDNVSLPFKDRIRGRLKIILCHCVLVIIAIICLIVSGILSILHPPDNIINGNYSDCTSDHDNITLEYF